MGTSSQAVFQKYDDGVLAIFSSSPPQLFLFLTPSCQGPTLSTMYISTRKYSAVWTTPLIFMHQTLLDQSQSSCSSQDFLVLHPRGLIRQCSSTLQALDMLLLDPGRLFTTPQIATRLNGCNLF